MKPTCRFRWVPRGEFALGETEYGDAVFGFKNVLQQWWDDGYYIHQEFIPNGKGEWRDVPVEGE